MQVFAQRRPVLHRVLDWEDECFALVTAVLDRQSLANSSATFADTLYGLRRAPYAPNEPPRSLTPRQQHITLLFLVGSCFLSVVMHVALAVNMQYRLSINHLDAVAAGWCTIHKGKA